MAPTVEKESLERSCFMCVDMGTTNTRVWLICGDRVVSQERAGVGVRDTARDGSATLIRQTLRDLIGEVRERGAQIDSQAKPSHIVAAGMITSALGLCEVPHVMAPAGVADLGREIRRCQFDDVCDLPMLLVPGVRCGVLGTTLADIDQSDVMRGEETLCMGLISLGLAPLPSVVINLGSHWKAIGLDEKGRVSSSVTSLAGELIHAAQTQTVLASTVSGEKPVSIDPSWCEAGMNEQRRAGLSRALFSVRLLDLNQQGNPHQRLSFLIGTFVASDLDSLSRRGVLVPGTSVLLAGGGAVADAWCLGLAQNSSKGVKLADSDLEIALFAGLRSVMEASDCQS